MSVLGTSVYKVPAVRARITSRCNERPLQMSHSRAKLGGCFRSSHQCNLGARQELRCLLRTPYMSPSFTPHCSVLHLWSSAPCACRSCCRPPVTPTPRRHTHTPPPRILLLPKTKTFKEALSLTCFVRRGVVAGDRELTAATCCPVPTAAGWSSCGRE